MSAVSPRSPEPAESGKKSGEEALQVSCQPAIFLPYFSVVSIEPIASPKRNTAANLSTWAVCRSLPQPPENPEDWRNWRYS